MTHRVPIPCVVWKERCRVCDPPLHNVLNLKKPEIFTLSTGMSSTCSSTGMSGTCSKDPLSSGDCRKVSSRRQIRRSRSRASFYLTDSSSDIDFENQKICKPHYSQLHYGKFELLSVDDDPMNQVIKLYLKMYLLGFPNHILLTIILQMVIESFLGPLGYVLTFAMDGDEALELMKTRDHLPDLVLIDVQMFERTGYDVRAVALLRNARNPPLIVVSS
jgi:CheY-like chemotaxis protein